MRTDYSFGGEGGTAGNTAGGGGAPPQAEGLWSPGPDQPRAETGRPQRRPPLRGLPLGAHVRGALVAYIARTRYQSAPWMLLPPQSEFICCDKPTQNVNVHAAVNVMAAFAGLSGCFDARPWPNVLGLTQSACRDYAKRCSLHRQSFRSFTVSAAFRGMGTLHHHYLRSETNLMKGRYSISAVQFFPVRPLRFDQHQQHELLCLTKGSVLHNHCLGEA